MRSAKDGRAYLAFVLEKLKLRIRELSLSIAEGEKEVEGMHEYYWENYTEMDQYGYEDYDNRQALLNQLNTNQEQLLMKQRFRRMLDSPFFGRVDFRYEGEEQPEIFYIGIGNFAEKTGGVPLVYDWRAPVSGLFYDFDKGEASYQAPLGIMRGELTSKWQYKIRDGKLVYEFESDVKIDDEILKAELGSHGEVQLKNIIRTIQKEQNAIIRNTKDRILAIQGAAGSGKTSVALHRIAYLLYHDRENLKSSNILILSPNGVFADYISHILPELGEENIQEMSFDLFAYRQLKDTAADCEDRCDQIEKMLKHPALARIYREKQSGEFLNQMEGYLAELEDGLMNFTDVEYRGFRKTEEEIINLFYFKFTDIPLLSRMEAVAEYFIDEVETLRGSDLPEEEREEVLERFFKMYETRDLYVIYSHFLESRGYRGLPRRPLEKRKLLYEDVYPLLYMKYRLMGQKEQIRIKHLVVDEMQDYSRLQYLIIKKLFPCRMTILGDKAQTMEEKSRDVLEFLPKIFGKDMRRVVMNKSYRNTVEIAAYANALAGIADMELFERHGKPVEELELESFSAALEAAAGRLNLEGKSPGPAAGETAPGIAPEPAAVETAPGIAPGPAAGEAASGTASESSIYETAAVILRSEEEAVRAAEILRELLDRAGFDTEKKLSYLNRDSSSFCRGLTVTTFYLAKGLEFDQVFCIFPEKAENPLEQQGKYIAATRALHELHMYTYRR